MRFFFNLPLPPNQLCRKRECEQKIPLSYLQKLEEGYNCFVKEICKKTIVFDVDWNEFGNVEDLWKKEILPKLLESKEPRLIKVNKSAYLRINGKE